MGLLLVLQKDGCTFSPFERVMSGEDAGGGPEDGRVEEWALMTLPSCSFSKPETLTCVLSVLWDSKFPYCLNQLLSGVLFLAAKRILMNIKGKYEQWPSISVFGWFFFFLFSLQCFKFKAWNRSIFQGVQRHPNAEHKLNIAFNLHWLEGLMLKLKL